MQRLFLLSFLLLFYFPSRAQQGKNIRAPYLAEGLSFSVGSALDSQRVTFSKGDEQSQVMSPGPNTIWLAKKKFFSSYSDLVITFAKPVTAAAFTISHINNNGDGMEVIDRFEVYDEEGKSISENTSIHWAGNPAITTFHHTTQVLKATAGHCCEEASGRLTLSSTKPFTTITFRQTTLSGVPNGVIISDPKDLSVKAPQPLKEIPTTITSTSLTNALAASQEKEKQRRDSTVRLMQASVSKEEVKSVEKKKETPPKVTAKKTSSTPPKKATSVAKKKTVQPTVKKKQPAHDIKELQTLAVGDKIKLNKVFFKQSVAELLPDSYQQLDTLVILMKQYKTLQIELQGHTDNQGDAEKNRVLSEQRVAVVKQYLVDKGIAAERLTTKGFGMTEPKAPNDTEENRKLNRRVEFMITKR